MTSSFALKRPGHTTTPLWGRKRIVTGDAAAITQPGDGSSPSTAKRFRSSFLMCCSTLENETHWTFDTELQEDRRRLAWSRHPHGVLAVSVLRMMALCILAVARRLSWMVHTRETPSWTQVAEHFLLQLCDSILETEAFDIV